MLSDMPCPDSSQQNTPPVFWRPRPTSLIAPVCESSRRLGCRCPPQTKTVKPTRVVWYSVYIIHNTGGIHALSFQRCSSNVKPGEMRVHVTSAIGWFDRLRSQRRSKAYAFDVGFRNTCIIPITPD